MVPVAPPALFPFADTTSATIGIASGWVCTSVMMPPGSLVLAGHRIGAGRDLGNLSGDLRLTRLVVRERQLLLDLFGIVRGAAHRNHPRRLLGGDPLQDRLIELHFDVARQEFVEHVRWTWLENVVGISLWGFWRRLDRKDLHHLRPLHQRVDESGIDYVDRVDLA